MFRNEIEIAGRKIGNEHSPFIVAEISGNHKQSPMRLQELIKAAKDAGADAVKFQTYTADTMTLDLDLPDFVVSGTGNEWEGRKLYDLYEEAHTPWRWFPNYIKDYCNHLGIIWFSSPFDLTAVDFLEDLDCPAYKIASLENTDLRLIRYVARKGKPVIISTGTATTEDILKAVWVCEEEGNDQVVVLKCNSDYPAKPVDMSLRDVSHIRNMIGLAGLSDHSLSSVPPVVSITLGACIIEKHITLDREDGGVASFFSLNPQEFKKMVKDCRDAKLSLTERSNSQTGTCQHLKRSLYVSADIAKGEVFTKDNIKAVRPGRGVATKHYDTFIGLTATTDISAGTPLSFSHTTVSELSKKIVDIPASS